MTSSDSRTHGARHDNWGRWGADDQVGALNLVTTESVRRACQSVVLGERISLARPVEAIAGREHLDEYQIRLSREEREGGAGGVVERVTISCHGLELTHIDALCHIWTGEGMWNGRDPAQALSEDGSTWAGIDAWSSGLVTRGVLLDVPQHRGLPYVDLARPVTGRELAAVAEEEGVHVEPGDAIVVYSGRERWDEAHEPWGTGRGGRGESVRPGLDESCVDFVAEHDVSALLWDMMDARPPRRPLAWPVHQVLCRLGVALVDNCSLERLVLACRAAKRCSFALFVSAAPLVGATGCPVNPIAVL